MSDQPNYVMPDEIRPGSDTRIRYAARALSADMRASIFPYLRPLAIGGGAAGICIGA